MAKKKKADVYRDIKKKYGDGADYQKALRAAQRQFARGRSARQGERAADRAVRTQDFEVPRQVQVGQGGSIASIAGQFYEGFERDAMLAIIEANPDIASLDSAGNTVFNITPNTVLNLPGSIYTDRRITERKLSAIRYASESGNRAAGATLDAQGNFIPAPRDVPGLGPGPGGFRAPDTQLSQPQQAESLQDKVAQAAAQDGTLKNKAQQTYADRYQAIADQINDNRRRQAESDRYAGLAASIQSDQIAERHNLQSAVQPGSELLGRTAENIGSALSTGADTAAGIINTALGALGLQDEQGPSQSELGAANQYSGAQIRGFDGESAEQGVEDDLRSTGRTQGQLADAARSSAQALALFLEMENAGEKPDRNLIPITMSSEVMAILAPHFTEDVDEFVRKFRYMPLPDGQWWRLDPISSPVTGGQLRLYGTRAKSVGGGGGRRRGRRRRGGGYRRGGYGGYNGAPFQSYGGLVSWDAGGLF